MNSQEGGYGRKRFSLLLPWDPRDSKAAGSSPTWAGSLRNLAAPFWYAPRGRSTGGRSIRGRPWVVRASHLKEKRLVPKCEPVFVTAEGSPLSRYRRAIESRSVLLAELSAREMRFVTLPDAVALVALYASEGSPRFDKAAVRWLARYALERDDVRLADLQMAAGALALLPERERRPTHIAGTQPIAEPSACSLPGAALVTGDS